MHSHVARVPGNIRAKTYATHPAGCASLRGIVKRLVSNTCYLKGVFQSMRNLWMRYDWLRYGLCLWIVLGFLPVAATAHRPDEPKKAPAVEGEYDMEITVTGAGIFPVELKVMRDEQGKLTCESKDQIGVSITGITVDDDGQVTLTGNYQGMEFEFKGRLEGDTMKGEFDISGYAGTWVATRRKPSKE